MIDLASFYLKWPLALLMLVFPVGLLVMLARRSGARWAGVLLSCGIAVLVLATARPMAQLWMPTALDRLVIAIDSSASMRADDVDPSRIEVAKRSARQLIAAMPSTANVTLVTASANASVVQQATRNREALHEALDRLALQPGSALGSAIAVSLANLLPEAKIDVSALGMPGARPGAKGEPGDEPFARPDPAVEVGSRKNSVIIVLADGDNNFGPHPRLAALIAQAWGVKIYTVGIGTLKGAVLRSDGFSARVRLEEKTLREIAEMSGGEYFSIAETSELERVYKSLSGRIGLTKRRETEITSLVATIGITLMLCGALFNVVRRGRIV
ncbi:MAG: VWA domain-containing protein [Quisquiliibacterium sp.]